MRVVGREFPDPKSQDAMGLCARDIWLAGTASPISSLTLMIMNA